MSERVLKFRAWDGDRMLYRSLFDRNWYATPKNDERGCHTVCSAMPDDQSHMKVTQFTGLLDRNGVEIYEGDVVRVGDGMLTTCEWRCGGLYLIAPNGGAWSVAYSHYGKPSEVIGNIYEHPHLIERAGE